MDLIEVHVLQEALVFKFAPYTSSLSVVQTVVFVCESFVMSKLHAKPYSATLLQMIKFLPT